jgi:hypothetical protein
LSNPVDKRQKLSEAPFDYQVTKDNKVFISYHNKTVKILSGKAAEKLLAAVEDADEAAVQLALAKVTGNFKHGNER